MKCKQSWVKVNDVHSLHTCSKDDNGHRTHYCGECGEVLAP